jgi:hypothetical protein
LNGTAYQNLLSNLVLRILDVVLLMSIHQAWLSRRIHFK